MIKSIIFKNFRNYSFCEVNAQNKVNMLIGENGQGKTNFLEAIYYMSYMRSFRKSQDNELIPHGENHFYFKGEFENENVETIEIGYDRKTKSIKINGVKPQTILKAVGKINVTLFSDTDIELIHSGPSVRRSFLDSTLSVVDENYLHDLYNYKKVLKMRNAAIKNYFLKKGDKNGIHAWDSGLVKYGSGLIEKRTGFIEEISGICRELYPVFTKGKMEMNLDYSPGINFTNDIRISFFDEINNSVEQDFKKGSTTKGPHRDDIMVKDKNKLLKKYASKGQARAAALILRLAQMKYIEKHKNKKCILLLDDILLDLDSENKSNFLNILGDQRQCFFTATSENDFKNISGSIYFVNAGNISISK